MRALFLPPLVVLILAGCDCTQYTPPRETAPSQQEQQPVDSHDPLPEGTCCCKFRDDGDILTEDAIATNSCPQRPSGQCIEVDPNRLTPHSCCPNATGERCGVERSHSTDRR